MKLIAILSISSSIILLAYIISWYKNQVSDFVEDEQKHERELSSLTYERLMTEIDPVLPDNPAKDFNDWSLYIRRQIDNLHKRN